MGARAGGRPDKPPGAQPGPSRPSPKVSCPQWIWPQDCPECAARSRCSRHQPTCGTPPAEFTGTSAYLAITRDCADANIGVWPENSADRPSSWPGTNSQLTPRGDGLADSAPHSRVQTVRQRAHMRQPDTYRDGSFRHDDRPIACTPVSAPTRLTTST